MERLTRKIAGSVALPLIPMDIKNKEDLEIYHKVRKQYEENTIKLAEYEDFVENVKDTLITDYSVFNTDDIRIFIDIIEELAEQLKAGK